MSAKLCFFKNSYQVSPHLAGALRGLAAVSGIPTISGSTVTVVVAGNKIICVRSIELK